MTRRVPAAVAPWLLGAVAALLVTGSAPIPSPAPRATPDPDRAALPLPVPVPLPLTCSASVDVPEDEVLLVVGRGGGDGRAAALEVAVVWVARPIVDNKMSLRVCQPARQQWQHGHTNASRARRSAPLQVGHSAGNGRAEVVLTAAGPLRVEVRAPWNRFGALQRAFAVRDGATGRDIPATHRVAACSDGLDNDGDGLVDLLDPDCKDDTATDSEDGPGLALSPHNFEFELGNDTRAGGAYFASLVWRHAGKDVPIVLDSGKEGNRFFLHSDSGGPGADGAARKFSSDVQYFAQGIFPWNPNTTTWKNQTAPYASDTFETMQTTVVQNTSNSLTLETTAPGSRIVDTLLFSGDTITITTAVTSLQAANCTVYLPLNLGNLQLGRTTTGCSCPVTIFSGSGSADGHGQSTNCTASCETGLFRLDGLRRGSLQMGQPYNANGCDDGCREGNAPITDPSKLKGWKTLAARGNAYPASVYSPVTALGDTERFTIGVQAISRELNPDNENSLTIEHYGIPAAPLHPLLSEYAALALQPNETRNFTTVIQLAAPGKWEDAQAAVREVLQPYARHFAQTYGAKPGYCPSGAVAMAFEGSGPAFNRSTHSFRPGSTLYTDDLGIDRHRAALPFAGMDKLLVWQGQIYSSLLMDHGSYEFNPNSDVLDPNLDACCHDAVWSNVTRSLAEAKIRLGWFGRPCSHIMQAKDSSKAATVECPSKQILTGYPTPCTLTDPTNPCTMASMATVDALVKRGVTAFYWDSYLCAGRMAFSQAVMKKYPHLFIMGEQGVDVDNMLISGLPWMAMGPGVWDPTFEPFNSVLQNIVTPLGTSIVGTFGADQNWNHTTMTLAASKSNSLMLLSPNYNGTKGFHKEVMCKHIETSYQNALWRYNQYGKDISDCAPPMKPNPKPLGC